MKKNIGIAAAVIIVAMFGYMLRQEFSTKKPMQQQAAALQTEANITPPIEVDEQAMAVKELERSAGKTGLSKLYIVKCSSCHGRDGKGPIGSSIAGKSVEYNMTALMKYKNNQVPNTLMKGILENTSEAELKTLAEEISTFK